MTRKPLIHFLSFGFLLAIVLLVLFGLPAGGDEDRRVIINDSDITQLRAGWYRQWRREPTQQELRGLVEQHVREEVLYREALARGFDENDQVVRRAMQQKMEFLGESQAEGAVPGDEEIQAYYALRKEKYRMPGAASFAHIYFNRDERGDNASAAARQTLALLQKAPPDSVDLTKFGDPIMLEPYYRDVDEQQVSSLFGSEFSAALFELEPGRWEGPLASGYGLHLVFLTEKEASVIPELDKIKTLLIDDMQTEAAKAAKELFYTEILRNYQIVYRGEVIDLLKEEEEIQ